MPYTLDFAKIRMKMILEVGGKNASLGEMFNHLATEGVSVPDGFAVTASAYWRFLKHNGFEVELSKILRSLNGETFANLSRVGKGARRLLSQGEWPEDVRIEIEAANTRLIARCPQGITLAVRSSATAEDLPGASFAGQMETYLNISGLDDLLDACRLCFASLFTDRAIKYRVDKGFEHMNVAVSVGVQRMVRSDLAVSGVGFTLDPETGNPNVIVLSSSYGLGENVVQGLVTPDQFVVFKGDSKNRHPGVVARTLGAKEKTMTYAPAGSGPGVTTVNRETDPTLRAVFSLTEAEVLELAGYCLRIEEHYGQAMDVEWAKDGETGELFIVQARPETVHGRPGVILKHRVFTLSKRGKVLAQGAAVGEGIASGYARRLDSPAQADRLKPGEILVTTTTSPDWDPILRKAAAIVTDSGGRTSHAAIVARELGVVALVGTGDATQRIVDGQALTISCAEGSEGYAYEGLIPFTVSESEIKTRVGTKPEAMLILADPRQAFRLALLPGSGVGLLRMEFAINNAIGVHPMALVKWDELPEGPDKEKIRELSRDYPDKPSYFVDRLAEAVGTIAAAFYPREVIVRLSDFKSNEYARLTGGAPFEPEEENPMLGFRGASRYTHPRYREGFRLECLAMVKVRETLGLTNVKLMVPFCRTVEEAAKVEVELAANGLKRGANGLEIYMMVEIPSNVLMMGDFARHFDGFSIGSNDLTQLTLGIDRDSSLVSPLFSENNPAVRELIARAIHEARRCGCKIGLCGQGPSDDAGFADFLVRQGIDSVSFNPDAFYKGLSNMRKSPGGFSPGSKNSFFQIHSA